MRDRKAAEREEEVRGALGWLHSEGRGAKEKLKTISVHIAVATETGEGQW
jgi:hypothetical protein